MTDRTSTHCPNETKHFLHTFIFYITHCCLANCAFYGWSNAFKSAGCFHEHSSIADVDVTICPSVPPLSSLQPSTLLSVPVSSPCSLSCGSPDLPFCTGCLQTFPPFPNHTPVSTHQSCSNPACSAHRSPATRSIISRSPCTSFVPCQIVELPCSSCLVSLDPVPVFA